MIVFLIMGSIVTGLGAILAYSSVPNINRRKRILAIPTSPIAQAPGNALVEIKGKIVPSEQGTIMTPFSNQPAVWARITVQEWQQRGRHGSWVKVLQESRGQAFMVDDGSGQLARVIPDGANFMLQEKQVARSGTFNNANPQLEAFLQSRGLKSTNILGLNKGMRYLEEVLAPGDPLYALGPSRRDPGPPVSDGYRMVPSTTLVMMHGGSVETELILTNKSEEKITATLLHGAIAGAVVLAVGVLILVGSLIQWMLATH
jgi:hypothetical protein